MRKYEKISEKQFLKDFKNYDVNYSDIIIPKRGTKTSAGYDFYLPFDITIEPNEVITIPTGIKVCMEENEFLGIYVRSSIGFKYNIRLCNQVGIIDADYYNNENNEGHMFVKLQNEGNDTVQFKKHDRFIQGIFQKYYVVEDEEIISKVRVGGIGSTNKGDEKNE